jgi:3-dehydroquinate dehydratase II
MKILVINGVNLNQLGLRDASNYGNANLNDITSIMTNEFSEIEFSFFQSNSETEIVHQIHQTSDYDGLIINPGAFTHTSIAIRDALETFKKPKVEVHLSNLSTRENFRNIQITTSKCDGYISGFKEISYLSAVYVIKLLVKKISQSLE